MVVLIGIGFVISYEGSRDSIGVEDHPTDPDSMEDFHVTAFFHSRVKMMMDREALPWPFFLSLSSGTPARSRDS